MPLDNLFPRMGSSGESPEAGKEFQASEQYDARYANYLWNGVERMFTRVGDYIDDHSNRHEHGGDDELNVTDLSSIGSNTVQTLYTDGEQPYWRSNDSPYTRLYSGSHTTGSDSQSAAYSFPLAEGPYSAYKIFLFGFGYGDNTILDMTLNQIDSTSDAEYTSIMEEQANITQRTDSVIRIAGPTNSHIHGEITINANSTTFNVTGDIAAQTAVPTLKHASINNVQLSETPSEVTLWLKDLTGNEWANYVVYGVKDRSAWGRTVFESGETTTETAPTPQQLDESEDTSRHDPRRM